MNIEGLKVSRVSYIYNFLFRPRCERCKALLYPGTPDKKGGWRIKISKKIPENGWCYTVYFCRKACAPTAKDAANRFREAFKIKV